MKTWADVDRAVAIALRELGFVLRAADRPVPVDEFDAWKRTAAMVFGLNRSFRLLQDAMLAIAEITGVTGWGDADVEIDMDTLFEAEIRLPKAVDAARRLQVSVPEKVAYIKARWDHDRQRIDRTYAMARAALEGRDEERVDAEAEMLRRVLGLPPKPVTRWQRVKRWFSHRRWRLYFWWKHRRD